MQILQIGLIMLIVGFVTTYLKITIDRIFLVLLLLMWMGFSIQDAIVINALTMAAASIVLIRGAKTSLAKLPKPAMFTIIVLSFLGGIVGRWISLYTNNHVLIIILGIYAILVGLRLVLIKPKMMSSGKITSAMGFVSLVFSILTGLISAGGKPLQVPIFAKLFKVSMEQAYLVATLGTIASVAGFIAGQLLTNHKLLQLPLIGWSWMYFLGISVVMYLFEPFWSQKGQKWVTLIVGPILVLVGLKLLI